MDEVIARRRHRVELEDENAYGCISRASSPTSWLRHPSCCTRGPAFRRPHSDVVAAPQLVDGLVNWRSQSVSAEDEAQPAPMGTTRCAADIWCDEAMQCMHVRPSK